MGSLQINLEEEVSRDCEDVENRELHSVGDVITIRDMSFNRHVTIKSSASLTWAQTFEEHLIFCCINSQIFPILNWKIGSIQLITQQKIDN